jgi:signal peptidase II
MLKWLWLSLFVILLDQATKYLADSLLAWGQPVPVLPFFNLTLLYNTGAAFSFLSNAGGWQRWFFILLALGVSAVLVHWLRRLPREQLRMALALSLILGGAIGNVIDRIWFGHVIDFIQLYYRDWYWPAFNVADSAITMGAVLLIWDGLFGKQDHTAEGKG